MYKATFEGRPVVIKTLKISGAADPKEVHKVSSSRSSTTVKPLKPDPKLLVKEVVGWKWLRHENILPFVGVTFTPPLISIVSERMENGNIMEFVRAHPNNNRLQLVSRWNIRLFSFHIDRPWVARRCSNWIRIPARTRYCAWRSEGGKLVSNHEVESDAEYQ